MNKARAMLDALMGPGRDAVIKDKAVSKEKFKDRSVCKSFLVGCCPLDKELLGGRRKFQPCDRLHSELMRDQFAAHPEVERLRPEYERLRLQDLEYCVRECENHIASERQRIREDLRRRKPALPGGVNDKLALMKRESSAMIQRAEDLDDDKLAEKQTLITRAAEMMKEREDYQQEETKKAIEALAPEEVCETCGVSYIGKDGDAAHHTFRIHDAYVLIRQQISELRPKLDELDRKRKLQKEEEPNKMEQSSDKERRREKDCSKEKARSKEKERSKDKGRSGDGDRKEKTGSRRREATTDSDARGDESRDRDRKGKRRRTRGRSESRGGGRRRRTSRRRGKSRSSSSSGSCSSRGRRGRR